MEEFGSVNGDGLMIVKKWCKSNDIHDSKIDTTIVASKIIAKIQLRYAIHLEDKMMVVQTVEKTGGYWAAQGYCC